MFYNRQIIKRSYLGLRDCFSLRDTDVLLVSYPKSGNTWMRFLICNYLEYIHQNYTKVDFEYLNKNMPEFGYNLHQNQYFGTNRRIVKTHKLYLPLFRNNASIYIIRHPKSVLKSFFHYNQNLEKNHFFKKQTFSQFIDNQYGIRGYLEHYKSWKDNFGLLIRYEDIEEKPKKVLSEIINYLEYPFSEEAILYAIEKSKVKTLKTSKNGHKEALKKSYGFIGNNAAKSNLIFSSTDKKIIKQQVETYHFTLYDLNID